MTAANTDGARGLEPPTLGAIQAFSQQCHDDSDPPL
jgi:hypothetical protein